MKQTKTLIVEDLSVTFSTPEGTVHAVNQVNFSIDKGSVLCLVGESGAGKSTAALSLLQLLPENATINSGRVYFNDTDLFSLSAGDLQNIRGKEISMAFQDPRASLNPALTIGTQIEEIVLAHSDVTKTAANNIALEMLYEMGLPDPKRILKQYPFHISGGMCQRVMLSIALALHPKLLIADEPTSNLDVTLQAEILERLKRLCKELGSALLLITHDMGVVANMADKVAIMYGGTVVEYADTKNLFQNPLHPYTWGLFRSLPRLDRNERRLVPLRGIPPTMIDMPNECPFIERCNKVTSQCRSEPRPNLTEIQSGHWAACYNHVRHD